jgi:tetratricopeptide (TPR) repeat protein
MTTQDRIKQALKLIEDDNYLKAFDEFSKLHYDFPTDPNIIKTCMFLLDRIIEANYDFEPETAEQYIFRGVSRFYKHDLPSSISDYDKALSINPRLDYAIKCKAFSLTHMGKFDLAIECLNAAIKIRPAGEYFDDLAENYSILGDNDKTIYFHEKAIEYSPNDARLFYNYGTHLGKYGQFEKAIEMFDIAIKIYPQYQDALYNRQHYLRRLKDK